MCILCIMCIVCVTRSRPDGSCTVRLKTWDERSQHRWIRWGWPGLVVAGPVAPQSPNGVHRITLNETLPELCRPGPFKELVHAATACLMAHQPLPQDVLSSFEPDQSPSCRGHKDFYQHSNFFQLHLSVQWRWKSLMKSSKIMFERLWSRISKCHWKNKHPKKAFPK